MFRSCADLTLTLVLLLQSDGGARLSSAFRSTGPKPLTLQATDTPTPGPADRIFGGQKQSATE